MKHQHPWCVRLLTGLSEDLIKGAVPSEDPSWEYVETELVKLGSLAHGQVDLDAVAEACLFLLESRTKDMRVLGQLLRCLQHPAKADLMHTALILLTAWARAYWLQAWPDNATQKHRLMVQIIKRFESALPRLSENAATEALEQLLAQTRELESTWLALCPDKNELLHFWITGLERAYGQRMANVKNDTLDQPQGRVSTVTALAKNSMAALMGKRGEAKGAEVEIDNSNERAWRQTLLNVAELLIERQPDAAMGYRLRRHAIWAGITTPPVITRDNKTQLAPMPVDLVDEYRAAIVSPTQALWKRVEQSLILSPYWFEGHQLSAELAQRLGFAAVSQAIMQELGSFLQRLPVLTALTFSNGAPFLPAESHRWLQSGMEERGKGSGDVCLAKEVAESHEKGGIGAALALLDERMAQLKEPRARFHAQLIQAELLAQEGMSSLARQHYQHLWQEASRLGLVQWEPGLVSRLEHHAACVVEMNH
jgi:type VI secretion-associated protein, VC_A0119 family